MSPGVQEDLTWPCASLRMGAILSPLMFGWLSPVLGCWAPLFDWWNCDPLFISLIRTWWPLSADSAFAGLWAPWAAPTPGSAAFPFLSPAPPNTPLWWHLASSVALRQSYWSSNLCPCHTGPKGDCQVQNRPSFVVGHESTLAGAERSLQLTSGKQARVLPHLGFQNWQDHVDP